MHAPPLSGLSRLAPVLLLACSASAAVLLPREARAGSPPSLTAQSEAQARFQTGLKYYDARDFESARLAFTQAYAVLQKPANLLNLALSEVYTDRPLEALEHLDRYLAETNLPDDKRERAKRAHEEAFKKTAHLALTVVPGTDVKVDGEAVSPIPPLVHLKPGAHLVEGVRGKLTKTVAVEAVAGETIKVDLRLVDGQGEAALLVKPDATLQGSAGAGAPPFTAPPPVGGDASTFLGWRSITGLALLGAGSVALVFGVVARGDASAAGDRATSLSGSLPGDGSTCTTSPSPTCSELARSVQDRNDAQARSDVLLVTGGAALAVGAGFVASAFLWPHRRASQAARLGPGPTALGLSFSTAY